jgi:hypothetical protein
MQRRPFLLLAIILAVSAVLQALFAPASPPANFDGKLPNGMVCTTCGPIPSAFAP